MTDPLVNIDDLKPEKSRAPFWARIRGYFLGGILITAPISITLYLAWALVTLIDRNVERLIPPAYNPEQYLPFSVPGIGLVIVILGLTLIGFLMANFLGRYLITLSERILDRLPVIRGIYSAIKQIMETIFASKEQAFREVVLVEYPRRGMWVIGFLVGKTRGEVQNTIDHDLVNVFIPTTPNPTSGFLVFIPREDIHTVNMSVDEGIKMVISAGIVTPKDVRSATEKKKTRIKSREMVKPVRKKVKSPKKTKT